MKVISFELAKQLEELGFNKDSEYAYNNLAGGIFHKTEQNGITCDGWTPAYTTDELLELLPKNICKDNEYFQLTIQKPSYAWIVHYFGDKNYGTFEDHLRIVWCNFLCDALAKMLIWCIEEGHLEV